MLAPRPERVPPPVGAGMALLGEFSRPSGWGMGVRLVRSALDGMGVATVALDADVRAGALPPAGMPLLLHVNPPSLPLALLKQDRRLLRGRRVVGMWNWELPVAPAAWRVGLRFVHEVWVSSHFTAAAMAGLLPADGRIPLRVVSYPLAVTPPIPAAMGREAFGDRADRVLVLKVGHPDHFPADFEVLRGAVAGVGNIRLETRAMAQGEVHALTACADIVLSLHRSEGFGLVPAEAMLLGRPVVATGWSGNMDFMDADSTVLVPFRLVPARDPRGVLEAPGAMWAEPDVGAAAEALRRLADDPEARRALGARGQAHARAALGAESLAAAMAGLAA